MKWCTFPDGKPHPDSLLPDNTDYTVTDSDNQPSVFNLNLVDPDTTADSENPSAAFNLNLVNGPPTPLSKIATRQADNQTAIAEEVTADI